MIKNRCLLPKLIRRDSQIKRSRQTIFGGLSSCPEASSHEIIAMEGLSPLAYPAIGTQERRLQYKVNTDGVPHGIFTHRDLIVAQGTRLYSLTRGGALSYLANVSDTDKTFAAFGSYLFIFPDGLCYDVDEKRIRLLHNDTGFLSDVTLGSNYLTCSAVEWEDLEFFVGDGVEISVRNYVLGSTRVFTCKITGISKNTLFLDKTFDLTGTYDIAVKTAVPDLAYACAVGDRLMGCVGNRIYLSEAGNPFNWVSYSGLDTDPVTITTGDAGDFTACASWQGYGVFFKKDHIYQLLGSGADDYVLSDLSAPGVAPDSSRSLTEVDGQLFYLADGGVYCFDGDYPTFIGDVLPYGLSSGVGGTDGICYYLTAADPDGVSYLYAYHKNRKMWFVQDLLKAAAMARWEDLWFVQSAAGAIYRNARRGEVLSEDQTVITETASVLPSRVEFGEEFGEAPHGLRLHGIHLRVSGSTEGTMVVSVAYDGAKTWSAVGIVPAGTDGVVHLPVYPRRAESYRLRISMWGKWRISEITCEYEQGK